MSAIFFCNTKELVTLKGDLRPKLHPCFYDIFINFMEKEPYTKFCGVLINFNEVMKLQSVDFGVSDIIPANVQNISPQAFFSYSC